MENKADAIIVGAGAAGLATGIFAAQANCPWQKGTGSESSGAIDAKSRMFRGACPLLPGTPNGKLRIVVFDGARRIGAKILVSGGGRCNVTNVRVTADDFYGGNRNVIRRVLAAFPEVAARRFFEEIGVALHEEEYGKLFPDSNSARTVVDALLAETDRLGVTVLARHRVIDIERSDCDFVVTVDASDGPQRWHAKRVVLATGGKSLPKTGSDGFGYELARRLGHTVSPTMPALDPLILRGSFHASLAGIAQDVVLAIHLDGGKPVRIAGPMLWTHFGVSGPAALNASRFWNFAQLERCTVRITANFIGGASFADTEKALLEAATARPRAHIANIVHTWLPARVAEAICAACDINPAHPAGQLTREARRRLIHALTEFPLEVTGTRGYRFAEVTAGGVPLSELDPATMESRKCPGLYLVGEILDVDGRLGGFNFQWAWSSGFVAGTALARNLPQSRGGTPA